MATVYVRNLNERAPLAGLKSELEQKFSEFGRLLGISAKKSLKMRGQAFVDFEDEKDAQRAIAALNNTELTGKTVIVEMAKSDSNAVHLLKTGTPLKRQRSEAEQPAKVKRQKVPNKILLLQNLPQGISVDRLNARYDSNDGFIEARVFAVRGIGFIEFDTVESAQKAMQGFEIDGNIVDVSFAR